MMRSKRSGSERRKASAVLTVRCTPEEAELLRRKAEDQSTSVSSLLKCAALEARLPRKRKRPTASERELGRLLGQLGKLGSNLNQLAKAANSGTLEDFRAVRAMRSEVSQMREAVMRALGRSP